MTRVLAQLIAAWVGISIPAALVLGRWLARLTDSALTVQTVQRRRTHA